MSDLRRIIIEHDPTAGTWTVTRQREENGEKGEFLSLEEALEFVRAHERPEEFEGEVVE